MTNTACAVCPVVRFTNIKEAASLAERAEKTVRALARAGRLAVRRLGNVGPWEIGLDATGYPVTCNPPSPLPREPRRRPTRKARR